MATHLRVTSERQVGAALTSEAIKCRVCNGAHLEEAVVAEEQGSSVDAKIEDAVMAGGDVQAHSRCDELHPLAALNLEHTADSSHHDLRREMDCITWMTPSRAYRALETCMLTCRAA